MNKKNTPLKEVSEGRAHKARSFQAPRFQNVHSNWEKNHDQ